MSRKRAVTKSEEYSESIINTVREPLIVLDQDLRVVTVSRSFYEFFKVNPEETVGQLIYDLGNKQWDIPKLRELLETILPEKATFDNYEVEHDFTGVGRRTMLLNARQIQRVLGKERIILLAIEDITERKRLENLLIDSEQLRYRLFFEEAQDGIAIAYAETGELVDCNQALCRMTEKDKTELLGQPQSILHPPQHQLINGFSSSFYFHKTADPGQTLEDNLLSKSGKIIPVEIKASRLWMNGCDYILGIFRDITERKKAEEDLKETLESLRKAIGTTIQVMVSAVETRDPYTAGHQRQSADLARAIATEMGLPPKKIEGIRMAGSIHDIGKLSIPAEILSKPTKLSELEFSMIKEHARKGFEMLKDVESPWSLAEIVYQHHERMDGSGYPRNLKGEEILIEARILAVADVVEAMASHRPYRAGLGIDAALNEIEKNRGIFYDSTVVDACLRLFREKGFKFEGT